MSDEPVVPASAAPAPTDGASKSTAISTTETTAEYIQAQALEKLPKETKELLIGISAFFRTQTGPDPETAKAIAESEMHQETCRLDGYREQLDKADKRHGRDHEFRMLRLKYDTLNGHFFNIACVVGIGIGLYVYAAMHDVTLGTNLMTGCFVALLGPKALIQKNKD